MLFGIGLAGAVALDALVIRTALVPGLMLLARQGQLVAAGLARPLPPAPQRRGRRARRSASRSRAADPRPPADRRARARGWGRLKISGNASSGGERAQLGS